MFGIGKSKSVVGLDIGSSAVKAVELKAAGKGFRVAAYGAEPVPADVTLDFALLPPRAAVQSDTPMETQPQLKGSGRKMVVKADAMALLIAASQP